MEVFRFIKWWWNRISCDDKFFFIANLAAIITVISLWHTNLVLIVILAYGGLAFFIVLAIWGLSYLIYDYWIIYKKQRDEEAEKIVAKLRGY